MQQKDAKLVLTATNCGIIIKTESHITLQSEVIQLKTSEVERIVLREARKQKGSQQTVAKELEISRQYLGMMETGVRNPTVKLMTRMESYFSVPAKLMFPDLFFEVSCHKTLHLKKQKSA